MHTYQCPPDGSFLNMYVCQPQLISFWAWMGHVDPKSAKDLQHAAAKPEWIHSARSPVRCCPIDTAQHPRDSFDSLILELNFIKHPCICIHLRTTAPIYWKMLENN